jgi:DNA invertase Pin-like site-specific DNA recombinase
MIRTSEFIIVPARDTKEEDDEIVRLFNSGMSHVEVAKAIGIATSTLSNRKRKLMGRLIR